MAMGSLVNVQRVTLVNRQEETYAINQGKILVNGQLGTLVWGLLLMAKKGNL